MLFLRNVREARVLALQAPLERSSQKLAAEKTLSEDAEVAGIARSIRAYATNSLGGLMSGDAQNMAGANCPPSRKRVLVVSKESNFFMSNTTRRPPAVENIEVASKRSGVHPNALAYL